MARSIATNTTVGSADLLDFVRAHHRLLATTRRDGRPQISPVSGGVDSSGRIVISTYPIPAKSHNAERSDPAQANSNTSGKARTTVQAQAAYTMR
jgi:hypothetical protein